MLDRNRRKSLLYYWSIRYFLLLITGLALVGALTLYLLHASAVSQQKRGMKNLVRDVALAAAANGGQIPGNPSVSRWLDDRVNQYGLDIRPVVIIFDSQGKIISQFPPVPPPEITELHYEWQDIVSSTPHIFTIQSSRSDKVYQAAVFPMSNSSYTTGYALYLMPKVNILQGMLTSKVMLVMFGLFMLVGWTVIYGMTRRVARPIRQAADAANQIVAGNYNLPFTEGNKEAEIVELMHSFHKMAEKLDRLEGLRSQLLAGVTHELKTPVTSISGLIQAVKGGVVTGSEADTFLEVCLQESRRLQKMIEDLLDFNRFTDSTVAVVKEQCDLDRLIAEIVERWRLGQGQPGIRVMVEVPERREGWTVWTDHIRMEQIIVNLLNNARDAVAPAGTITVRLAAAEGEAHVQVHDTGKGIGVSEHGEIFKPFYRGDNKKARVRGLGIGLTFSRMLARALGGDLTLSGSTPGSTTFTLALPTSQAIRPDR